MNRRCAHALGRARWLMLPLLLAVGLLLVVPTSAEAATITVTSTGEEKQDDGLCTLLEALTNAQFDTLAYRDCLVAGDGADTIAFNIPAAQCPGGVCTISMSSTYPLVGPLTIDGYTQPGASPNTLAVGTNAVLRIVLRRQGAGATTAIAVAVDDVTVRGIAISDYSEIGIRIDGGARARIIGCFIGTDVTGALDRAIGDGIWVTNPATDVRIGGASPADRNLISGNNFFGIFIQGPNAVIQGNAIGTNAAGTAGIPNGTGIGTGDGSVSNATIGGVSPGEGNVVAYNSNAGIDIYDGVGNRILGNAIYSNTLIGIDLRKGGVSGAGVTPNDPSDVDTGANNLQNFPVLTSAGARVNTTVHGTLNSRPFFDYRIELFSNTACDASGNGEGETFIGFVNVTADELGNASFVGVFPPVLAGRFITATATVLTAGVPIETSEFSACRPARPAEVRATNFTGQQITSLTTTEANQGGAVFTQFQLGLSSIPTANVTVPISVSDSTEGAIVFPSSPMTFVPGNFGTVQQVRIVGVDDGIDDGDMPYAFVIGPASSADPNYNGLDSADVPVTNIDNDDRFGAMCRPRPPVRVSVAKIGGGQLRATVTIGVNAGTQNELVSIAWTRFDTATVVLDGVGPVQVGQTSGFPTPLTQSASFVITRTPGASSGTVRLVVTDGCGTWPTFVGGGPSAW